MTTPRPDELAAVLVQALRQGPCLVWVPATREFFGLRHRREIAAFFAELAALPNEADPSVEPGVELLLTGTSLAARQRARAALADPQEAAAIPRQAVVTLVDPAAVARALPPGIWPRLLGALALDSVALLAWVGLGWILGAMALGGQADSALLLGWALLLFGRLVALAAGSWLRAVAFQGWAEGWRRLLWDQLADTRHAPTDPGALTGGLAEIENVEEASHAGILGLALGLLEWGVAALVLAQTGPAVAWLFLLVLGIGSVGLGVYSWQLFAATRQWSESRMVLTQGWLARLARHARRWVFGDRPGEIAEEDRELVDYAHASRRIDRVALAAAFWPPRWVLVAGVLALVPLVVFGEGRPMAVELAVALGGILLSSSALVRLGDALAALAAARAARLRLRDLLDRSAPPPKAEQLPLCRPAGELRVDLPAPAPPLSLAQQLALARGAKRRIAVDQAWPPAFYAGVAGRESRSGRAEIDGLPARLVGPAAWDAAVEVLTVDTPGVVAGNLAFNLLVGRQWPPSPADLELAAAWLEEWGLEHLLTPAKGWGLVLGSGGRAVSAGEAARISLLRALLREPDFLVLEDPLVSLDLPLRAAVATRLAEAPAGLLVVEPRDS